MIDILETKLASDGETTAPTAAATYRKGRVSIRVSLTHNGDGIMVRLMPGSTCNGVEYLGSIYLTGPDYGSEEGHPDYYLGWRRRREGEPGYLDRSASRHFFRASTFDKATDAALKAISAACEAIAAEVIRSAPMFDDESKLANLRRELATAERKADEAREAHRAALRAFTAAQDAVQAFRNARGAV